MDLTRHADGRLVCPTAANHKKLPSLQLCEGITYAN